MADGTRLNTGTGGDIIWTEDFGASGKIPRSKLALGAVDADNGDISAANPMPSRLTDGNNTVTVAQFHNQDNQSLGSGYGLTTGGVTQIKNAIGNLDRQAETGIDSIPALGITTGAAQFAMAFSTTDSTDNLAASPVKSISAASNAAPIQITATSHGFSTGNQVYIQGVNGNQAANGLWTITVVDANNFTLNGSTGTGNYISGGTATLERTFTPAAMSGTIMGVGWSIQIGSVLTLDSGANQEVIVVAGVTSTTFSCTTKNAHNGTVTPFTITGFVYNQERDASGELGGASGQGTAIAVEYESNGGAANGLYNYDPERNLQGKGIATAAISNNPLAAGSTTLTCISAPSGLMPGTQIYILDGANSEAIYVANSYAVGSTSVPLRTATAFSHAQNTTLVYSRFMPLGPQSSYFTAECEGMEGLLVYDPTVAANDPRCYRMVQGLAGSLFSLPYPGASAVSGALASDLTTTTSTQLIAAPGAGLHNYITQILVSNAHASVDTRVDILDGASLLYTGFAVHGGGGYSITFPTPLRQPTANQAINVQCGTTGAQVRASINGFTAP